MSGQKLLRYVTSGRILVGSLSIADLPVQGFLGSLLIRCRIQTVKPANECFMIYSMLFSNFFVIPQLDCGPSGCLQHQKLILRLSDAAYPVLEILIHRTSTGNQFFFRSPELCHVLNLMHSWVCGWKQRVNRTLRELEMFRHGIDLTVHQV